MSLLSILRVASRALLRNRMRSFLTTLGVIIGVAAVIAMVAIGEGAKARVEQSFASMGTSLLIVMSGSSTSGGARGGFGSMPTLTWDDLQAIQAEVPSVRVAAPSLRSTAQLVYEDQNWSTSVTGTTPEYFEIRSWRMSKGAAFTQSDIDGSTKVSVLGQTVVTNLFGASADPVGQVFRIRNIPFQVVGVLERKGQSPMGQDYDDTVVIPSSTFQSKIQGGLQKYLSGAIMVSAVSPAATERAERDVANLLRDRHRIQPGSDDDFSIRNLTEIASAQQEGTRTLTLLLSSIAAVSLLVGGIGIMNIMLVSVTERTREIGLRMAVGAHRRHFLRQFLVEAFTLSSLGGAIGIALGVGTSQMLAAVAHWPTLVSADAVVIAFLFSAAVGVFFGYYPARQASRLNPSEALRYE
jgi:putative ABC transport system permease protein